MTLTHQEEIELARKRDAGDLQARNLLIENNIGLVKAMARRYYTDDPATDREDLIQHGMVGLITAADRYDPAKGTRFSTYAYLWIQQAIGHAARAAGTIKRRANDGVPTSEAGRKAQELRHSKVGRLDAPLVNGEDDALIDVLPALEPPVEETALNRVEVDRVLDCLTLPHHRLILQDFMNGMLITEASIANGYSRNLGRMVILSLRERLANHG